MSLMADEKNVRRFIGADIFCTDGQTKVPEETPLTNLDAYEWFSSYPDDSVAAIRLLTYKLPPSPPSYHPPTEFDVPFSREAVGHAIWGSGVYYDISTNPSGGCATLLDDPWRFILQTPNDGQPFVSLALSRVGDRVKGVYAYDHPDFDPTDTVIGQDIRSGWRSDGLQIINLAQAFLKVHSKWLARELADMLSRIRSVEAALSNPAMTEFSHLQRALHECIDRLFTLERRSRFESLVIEAIEATVAKSRYGGKPPWPALAPAKASLKMRTADFETLPRRIKNARTAINDTILQRTQQQNLQLAEATRTIAEATMKDSAAMRTIAVLTMVLLPATTVASFFSMTMWDWSANDGNDLASGWLWVYFAVTVPLTVAVLVIWWLWTRMRERQLGVKLGRGAVPAYSSRGSLHTEKLE